MTTHYRQMHNRRSTRAFLCTSGLLQAGFHWQSGTCTNRRVHACHVHPRASPYRFAGTRPKACTASREPATIGRIGMAARVRGGWLSDRFRSIAMPLATATRAPTALDIHQEWRVPFFSGNQVGC
jgi:hypothetical protein